MSENIKSLYAAAVEAVRQYGQALNELQAEERPAMMFLADEPGSAENDASCIITGHAPDLYDLLGNAAMEVPRLACAVVVTAEIDEVKAGAFKYIGSRMTA